jgi:xylulokinase
MARTHVVGVDLGTTGTKAAVFDEDGRLVAEAYRESKLAYPRPGWVEQDPDDIYGSAVQTIRQCLTESRVDPGSIAAVAFDGQMAGIGSVDPDWNTPTHYDSWLDVRCRAHIARLAAHAGQIIDATGGPPTISHGAKMLWWMHERPDVFRRITRFVVPGGYVAGRMAGLRGEQAFIDRTYLHFTCLSDTASARWSDELVELLGIPAEKLPRIVDPAEVIGAVTSEASAATGLKAGTPIAAGCGDQAAGMLGAAMVRPGMVFDVAGTASVFAVCLDRFVPDRQHGTLFTAHLAIPGLYYALAYINGGGLNLRWFRDSLAADEKEAAAAAPGGFYGHYDRLAEAIPPGCEGLVFLPHLGGRVCPSEPDMRGVFLGLHWAHTRAHLYRAMLEAVAYEYAGYLGIVRGLLPGLSLDETRVIGGGARSLAWNQIKADVLDVPYVTLNRQEFAALGSAILAGHAVGLFPDLAATAESFVEITGRIEPRAEMHQAFQPWAELYQRTLEHIRPLFETIAAASPADKGEGM